MFYLQNADTGYKNDNRDSWTLGMTLTLHHVPLCNGQKIEPIKEKLGWRWGEKRLAEEAGRAGRSKKEMLLIWACIQIS